jgi:hypothetical protein
VGRAFAAGQGGLQAAFPAFYCISGKPGMTISAKFPFPIETLQTRPI